MRVRPPPHEDDRGRERRGLILGTATFSMFLMLTLYMQQVLGYSPMKTGLGYLAVAVYGDPVVGVAAQLMTRIGVKPVLVTGMAALTGGLVYFTQVSVHGSYVVDLLPGFLLVGVGLGFSFVPISIAALAGVGAARGGPRIGAHQHVAADRRRARHRGALDDRDLPDRGRPRDPHALPSALVDGFTGAFIVGAGVASSGGRRAGLIRRDDLEQLRRAELEPALDLAAISTTMAPCTSPKVAPHAAGRQSPGLREPE